MLLPASFDACDAVAGGVCPRLVATPQCIFGADGMRLVVQRLFSRPVISYDWPHESPTAT
jgi:hypothetical protein